MKKNGFTIIELLVVIAIISILAVIGLGQYRQSMIKASDVQRKTDLNSLYKGLLMVYGDSGTFPSNADISWGGELSFGEVLYMKQVPVEKKSNLPYIIQTDVERKKIAIFSDLENSEDPEYNKYCDNGYNVSGKTYHYVIFSSNTSGIDFPVNCN